MNIEHIYRLFSQNQVVTTDSRNVPQGSMYIALKGEHFDGNSFATEALAKGAAYAVIDKPVYLTNERMILVDNALETLQKLANYHRKKINCPIIAITGTNGKTTTKELIHQVLSQKYVIRSTPGNLNNSIGVPLTLLRMDHRTELGIVEMGANHIREIYELCQIAEPDYGIITNIGRAHLEGFGGFEGVIKAKNELYQYLIQKDRIIFYCADNPLLSDLLKGYSKKNSYGYRNGTICRGTIRSVHPFITLDVYRVESGKDIENCLITSYLFGEYNAENILAACSVGMFFNVPLQNIREAIASYFPTNNRSQIKETNANKLVLDCYNSNPSSCEKAIQSFMEVPEPSKTIILGDMYELGDESEVEHKKVLDQIHTYKNVGIYLVGHWFKTLAPDYLIMAFSNVQELKIWLTDHPIKNHFILIKGSRGNKLENIIDVL